MPALLPYYCQEEKACPVFLLDKMSHCYIDMVNGSTVKDMYNDGGKMHKIAILHISKNSNGLQFLLFP